MKLKRTIRTVTPIMTVVLVSVVLLNTYRGLMSLPRARIDVVTPLTELETSVNDKALPARLSSPVVVILKSQHRLELYDGKQLIRSHQMALGKRPTGDKVREGDASTPEGTFYVCTKNPQSRYDRFLGISYPNGEDAARGLRAGLINKTQCAQIKQAVQQGKRPPWNTPLGGQIGIHGGGIGRDWTQGCIAITDEAVEELFDAIPIGTVVVIKP
jgi:murein L,D-transpeptidase YafK